MKFANILMDYSIVGIVIIVMNKNIYRFSPCTVRTPNFNLKEPENGYTYV